VLPLTPALQHQWEKDVQVTSQASSALGRWTFRGPPFGRAHSDPLAREAGLDGFTVAWLTGWFRARRRWA
jgi:hypothetical protein